MDLRVRSEPATEFHERADAAHSVEFRGFSPIKNFN
jgi:hypothetical protein